MEAAADISSSVQDSGKANLRRLAAVWCAFILSFLILARVPFGLVLIPVVSLVFQQYLSGVIHEAAHWHFYRRNLLFNDQIGTWGASFVFGYSLPA
jgi:fatty acid desaturase